MTITTIIFDMDGVISDTQTLHASIESKLLAKYGIYLTYSDIMKQYAGTREREMFEQLFRQYGVQESLDSVIKEKWELMNFAVQQILGRRKFMLTSKRDSYKSKFRVLSPPSCISASSTLLP